MAIQSNWWLALQMKYPALTQKIQDWLSVHPTPINRPGQLVPYNLAMMRGPPALGVQQLRLQGSKQNETLLSRSLTPKRNVQELRHLPRVMGN